MGTSTMNTTLSTGGWVLVTNRESYTVSFFISSYRTKTDESEGSVWVQTDSLGIQISFYLHLTSGARYSGVPQKVFMVAVSVMPSLQRPKSVILM